MARRFEDEAKRNGVDMRGAPPTPDDVEERIARTRGMPVPASCPATMTLHGNPGTETG